LTDIRQFFWDLRKYRFNSGLFQFGTAIALMTAKPKGGAGHDMLPLHTVDSGISDMRDGIDPHRRFSFPAF
jgi:hypothetical protein